MASNRGPSEEELAAYIEESRMENVATQVLLLLHTPVLLLRALGCDVCRFQWMCD